MHVDQGTARRVAAQIAVHAGELEPGRRDGALEAELQQHFDQGGPRGRVHQQIQVTGTRQPAVALGVTLPLAVRDAGALERCGEPLDERRRRLPDR